MSKKFEPGMAFDIEKLNKVFAFVSILLLMTVFWFFLDDYIKPWKKVQIDAMEIKNKKITQNIKEENEKITNEQISEVKNKIEKAKSIVKGRSEIIDQTEKEIAEIIRDIKNENIINGILNAKVGEVNFYFGSSSADNSKDLYVKLKGLKEKFSASNNNLKLLRSQKKSLKNKLKNLHSEINLSEKEMTKLISTRDKLYAAQRNTEINPLYILRNSPMIDFLDPTLKIKQVVLDNITDDRFFRQVPKVDRCMTCHTFINTPGNESMDNPHKTHPNLDLILGEKSPHPMKKIGCTVCHGGEGHRVVDFNAAAHTPRNNKQKLEWEKKYDWHAPHKVTDPMVKVGMTEGRCIKCHSDVEYVSQAPVLNEGRNNIEKFGCYACHKIKGWEHKRKPGPSLQKISSKVSKDFFKKWVWNPKSFNKHAKMPSFFLQSNNKNEEFKNKNMAEVDSMAEYIWSISEKYQPFKKFKPGDIENGKELITKVGCLACHGVKGLEDEFDKIKTANMATKSLVGPYLSGLGSKVNKDWLVSWLLKPSHYQEDTIMPSFRLNTKEARDIASYLLSQVNEDFDKSSFENVSKELRDEMLVTYFSAFDTTESAKNKLSKMTDRERVLELGKRSVGKYGCYSCHSLNGFEGRSPIGPELSYFGSKPLAQMNFGHEHDIGHSRSAWTSAHLENPRRWDAGTDKPFKDLLRMPHFSFSKREIETINVALQGQLDHFIPLAGMKRLDSREKIVEDGNKIINKFNCQGCHKIDGVGGDILAIYDDEGEAPPFLIEEGSRVQTDWLYHFLNNVDTIRPNLEVRMPSFKFSEKERDLIINMFKTKAHQNIFVKDPLKVSWIPGERKAAIKLFNSLDCVSCHTHTGSDPEDASAPDLRKASARLRPQWIKTWLSDPTKILPYTVMPNFWEDGESFEPDILGGDKERQINALAKYIKELGGKHSR